MQQQEVEVQQGTGQDKGFWGGIIDGISSAYNTVKQGATQAYDRAKTVGQGGMQIAGGIGDGISAVSKAGGGLSKIYKGVTGNQVPNAAKYAAAGLLGLTALNTVPGVGLITSGLTSVAGGLAKNAVKGSFSGVSKLINGGKKTFGGLKSLAQTLHSKGKQNFNDLGSKTKGLYQNIKNQGQLLVGGLNDTYQNVKKHGKRLVQQQSQQVHPYEQYVQVVQEGQIPRRGFRTPKTKQIGKQRERKMIFKYKNQEPQDLRKLAYMK